jgi:hypothetical protein
LPQQSAFFVQAMPPVVQVEHTPLAQVLVLPPPQQSAVAPQL